MSSFFDELETQLRTAAHARVAEAGADERATPPRRRRRRGGGWSWLRTGLRAAPVLAAVATTVVIAGAALLLFGHGTHHRTSPTTGNLQSILLSTPGPQLRRELGYIQSATRHVSQSPVCRTRQPAKVTFINGSPGRDLLGTLGVLRRHQTAADRHTLPSAYFGGPEQIYRGYQRRALVSHGVSYYIVAAREDRFAGMPSDRCVAMEEAALRSYAPKIPPSVRTQTLAIQTGFLAYLRRLVATAPPDGICLVTVGGGDSGGGCTTVASQIQAGEQPSDDDGTFSAVVPDGVAAVTLRFPAVRGAQAASVTASVHGNMYAVRGPRAFSGVVSPPEPTMLWRSAQGRVLRTIAPPPPGAAKRYCATHPIPCLLISSASSGSSSSSSTTASVAPSAPRR